MCLSLQRGCFKACGPGYPVLDKSKSRHRDIKKCYTTNKGRKVRALSSMSSEQGSKGQWYFAFNMPRLSKLNTSDDVLLVGYLGYMDKRPYKAWLVPDSVLNQHEAVEGSGVMHDHKNHNYLSVSILDPRPG
jgi:hypothetical protein